MDVAITAATLLSGLFFYCAAAVTEEADPALDLDAAEMTTAGLSFCFFCAAEDAVADVAAEVYADRILKMHNPCMQKAGLYTACFFAD